MPFDRDQFPVFTHHPDMIYLDAASTTPKPSFVIDRVQHYITHDYANIHRGEYALSLASEQLYRDTKQALASRIGAMTEEIMYTASATASVNLLTELIRRHQLIKAGEIILLSIAEHHANIVPRQMLCEEVWCRIERVGLDEAYCIDIQDFWKKYTDQVRIVSLQHISNTTWAIHDITQISSHLREDTLLFVDASQSMMHTAIDMQERDCDACFFTGHKMFAYTGIGVLYLKQSLQNQVAPVWWGGWAVQSVTCDGYELIKSIDRFEPGTPNLIGIASMRYALEYIQQQWWYETIVALEYPLLKQLLEGLQNIPWCSIFGNGSTEKRVGVVSCTIVDQSMTRLAQYLASINICVRAGAQCAHPLHQQYDVLGGTCRVSIGPWTTSDEISILLAAVHQYLQG
jgi:cysteine desulfurase/selenocysteine lyase